MDVAKIVKEQRDMILQKYGFQIKIEKDNKYGKYKYTITTRNDGGFVAEIERKTKDELDTLLNLVYYMDSVPYKVSYAKAEAYDDCVRTSPLPFYKVVNKSKEANKIRILDRSEFEEAGLVNIDAFYLKGVLGLEQSRKTLPELYSELKWLKENADREQVDYEEIVPEVIKPEDNLMPCGSGFEL